METLLYSEINIFTVVLLSIIAIKAYTFGFDNIDKRNLFIASVWFAAAANVFDFCWNLARSGMLDVRPISMCAINFMYFMTFACAAMCWFLYSESVRGSNIFKSRFRLAICVLPLLVLAGLLIVSLFNGCVFWISSDKSYHRGPLFYAQHVLSNGYILLASIKAIYSMFSRKGYVFREDLVTISIFIIPPIICMVAQAIFQTLPILSVGVVASYLLAYMRAITGLISIDALTKINNRRELLKTLSSRMDSLKRNEDLYFLFMDVDYFKHINDQYGHEEGDKALKLVGSALSDACKNTNGVCGRYGGDEFAMVQTLKHGESISDVYDEIYRRLHSKKVSARLSYRLELSIGCAKAEPDDNLQSLIARADEDMYRKKKQKKAQRLRA